MPRKLLLLGIAACLCGCVRPEAYHRPLPPVPNTWPDSAVSRTGDPGAGDAATAKWQDFFTDRQLQSVIELALANNRDLRVAALNVEKVQALYRIQRAQQVPTVTASASGNVYRLPRTTTIGEFFDEAVTLQEYNINLGTASWELDLFGRVRSLKSAALEQYLATNQARTATQIALVGAVAKSYLALAADRDSLRLAQ